MTAFLSRSLTALLFAGLFGGDAKAACDDLAGKLLSTYLDPAVKSLGCQGIGKAGLDNADHKLESACYSSAGPTSSVEIVANLHCHTSDKAFIKSSVSERVTANAVVRGADCSVEDVKVNPSGEIGKLLSKAFDVEGLARTALQEGLNKICATK